MVVISGGLEGTNLKGNSPGFITKILVRRWQLCVWRWALRHQNFSIGLLRAEKTSILKRRETIGGGKLETLAARLARLSQAKSFPYLLRPPSKQSRAHDVFEQAWFLSTQAVFCWPEIFCSLLPVSAGWIPRCVLIWKRCLRCCTIDEHIECSGPLVSFFRAGVCSLCLQQRLECMRKASTLAPDLVPSLKKKRMKKMCTYHFGFSLFISSSFQSIQVTNYTNYTCLK